MFTPGVDDTRLIVELLDETEQPLGKSISVLRELHGTQGSVTLALKKDGQASGNVWISYKKEDAEGHAQRMLHLKAKQDKHAEELQKMMKKPLRCQPSTIVLNVCA